MKKTTAAIKDSSAKQTSKSTSAKKTTAKSTTVKSTEAKKIPAKKDAAEDLRDFLIDGLKDLYWAEKGLVKHLPVMAENATSPKLKMSIEKHLEETENQVTRLEDAFKAMDEKKPKVSWKRQNLDPFVMPLLLLQPKKWNIMK